MRPVKNAPPPSGAFLVYLIRSSLIPLRRFNLICCLLGSAYCDSVPPKGAGYMLKIRALKGVSNLVSHAFLPATGADTPDSPSSTSLHCRTCRQNNQGLPPATASDCPSFALPGNLCFYRPSALLRSAGLV